MVIYCLWLTLLLQFSLSMVYKRSRQIVADLGPGKRESRTEKTQVKETREKLV